MTEEEKNEIERIDNDKSRRIEANDVFKTRI